MQKICQYCGDGFETQNERRVYCSENCRKKSDQAKQKAISARKKHLVAGQPLLNPDDQEDFGVYLCHKWKLEGLSVKTIAQIKNATTESVRRALQTPLSDTQKALLRAYFDPRP